jgi:dolichol-phosphate mannosyltransferase
VRTIVVVPTYNERDNVGRLLAAVRREVPSADVLVVDDSSPDGTAELAEATAAELGQIKVIRRPGKQGLGSAYRDGFKVALDEGYDTIVSMDVDFSHDPHTIPTMLSLIAGGADAVIGSRYVPGGHTVNWPFHRRFLSKWGNRYAAFMLGLAVRDCTSGFRAYRSSVLRAIDPSSTTAEGYAFLTELVRRLAKGGFEVMETPITFTDREVGTSKMSRHIIVESMLLVTRWGLTDRLRRRRRAQEQTPSGVL